VKLNANLVVDATGRSSASSRWLAALGYEKPPEILVTVELGYATRQYLRPAGSLENTKLVVVSADPPHSTRCGVIMPIEGDRWIVTLAGWGDDQPPLDEQGFVEFARNLPAPDIYNLVSCAEPVSEIFGYKYPASLRRQYEKVSKFPAGYLVMGDALCSFDPVYGQGMTSAALQAKVLDELLQTQPNVQGLAERFYKRVAKIVDIPWKLSTGEDFRFPQTQGKKPTGTDLMNAYVSLVHQATHRDQFVHSAFLRVINLLEAPSILLHPKIVWRVLRANS
jgi:flavin-dependent dehydrogenase